MQRWSILWRTIVLSALGHTLYPYCRHLRVLDLRDLGYLLEDDKFRGKISKHFFSGEMARFQFMTTPAGKTRSARLDRNKIINAIADEITQQAPLLEALSEPTGMDTLISGALLDWAPRLSHLRRLDLFDGKAFADETLRNMLHAHCPNLDTLKIYLSTSPDTDNALATFINGMQPNKLVYFENLRESAISSETFLALDTQGQSLRQLKLDLSEEGILALARLQRCNAISTLSISTQRPSVDLKATQNDVYLQIVEWLKSCKGLKSVTFNNIVSAPDFIAPVLSNNRELQLEDLTINATKEEAMYVVKDHHDFHQALSGQNELRRLHLRAEPEPTSRDDIERLIGTLCKLKNLRELKLTRISDYFSDEQIILISHHLLNLEDLYVGGYGVSDAVFPAVAKLKKLKVVSFSGITTFTSQGIMDFIQQLGPGNAGLVLSVDSADPDSAMSPEEQELIRNMIKSKVDGRFEYQLLRGQLRKSVSFDVR